MVRLLLLRLILFVRASITVEALNVVYYNVLLIQGNVMVCENPIGRHEQLTIPLLLFYNVL